MPTPPPAESSSKASERAVSDILSGYGVDTSTLPAPPGAEAGGYSKYDHLMDRIFMGLTIPASPPDSQPPTIRLRSDQPHACLSMLLSSVEPPPIADPGIPDEFRRPFLSRLLMTVREASGCGDGSGMEASTSRQSDLLYGAVRFLAGGGSQGSFVSGLIGGGIEGWKLLGVLCKAGVRATDLKEILSRSISPVDATLLGTMRDMAEEGTGQVKARPRAFFNLGGDGPGLKVDPDRMPTWAFTTHYRVAAWFRAERFPSSDVENPEIIRLVAESGHGFIIGFEVNDGDGEGTASVVVDVLSRVGGSSSSKKRTKLEGCALFPRQWYFLSVSHTHPRGIKNIFGGGKDELTITIDNKAPQTQPVKFPRPPATPSGQAPALKTLEIGRGFDGQLSTVYVLKESIDVASVTGLMSHSGGLGPPSAAPPDIGPASAVFAHVYDPTRTDSESALDLHSGGAATFGVDACPWVVSSPKDVINSIGGIQTLLPLFHNLPQQSGGAGPDPRSPLIPTLFSLLSSFLRSHVSNCRELHRCGGIEIIASALYGQRSNPHMLLCRYSRQTAQALVDALMDLRSAVSCYGPLTDGVYGQLLFNIPLWLSSKLSDDTPLPGIALHAALLPVLSALCQTEPKRVRDVVTVSSLVSYLNAVTTDSSLISEPTVEAELFSRGVTNGLPPQLPLTRPERRHIAKILLGMIITAMSSTCDVVDLQPLLLYINCHIDKENETALDRIESNAAAKPMTVNADPKEFSPEPNSSREDVFLSAKDAALGLLYLLQKTNPSVPLIYTSMEKIFSGSQDTAVAWILTCLVNSYDDSIRGIGIRILTCYIDNLQSQSGSGPSATTTAGGLHIPLAAAPRVSISSSSSFSLFKTVGENMKAGIGKVGADLGVNLMASTPYLRVNTKIAYKLLWHRCRSHRMRLGVETHDALMDMIVVGDGLGIGIGGARGAGERQVIESDHVCHSGFVFTGSQLYSPASAVIDDSKALRSLECLSVVLRLLSFLPTGMKEKWLFELLTLVRVSPASVREIVKNNHWQPYLFSLVSDILEEVKESGRRDGKTEEGASGGSAPKKITREQTSPATAKTLASLKKSNEQGEHSESESSLTGGDLLLREWTAKADDEDIDGSEIEDLQSNKEEGQHEENVTEESREHHEENVKEESRQPDEQSEEPSSQEEKTDCVESERLLTDVSMRFDLSMKLYSMMLAHSIREGGEHAFKALETAASLQRICVNGHEVFCALFSHVMADLTDNGTVINPDEFIVQAQESASSSGKGAPQIQRNKALKQSASIVTAAASSDVPNINMSAAIKQWRCLCHLTVINVAIITKLKFGVTELLDWRVTSESLEADKDGIGGIRLPQSNIPALDCKNMDPRLSSVTLAAQLLSLLDAFIFPSDSNKKLGKSYGMALVRATENRLGQNQGPLLASLIRLSVLLISHLEPCSLRFLHACGRLRTFSRWLLALIRENSSALGGLATPFGEATAQLDRLALAVVMHAHRALEKCGRMLSIFESKESTVFERPEDKKKILRRLMKASHELREIIVYLNSNCAELMRLSLAPKAIIDLKAAIDEGNTLIKENRGSVSTEAVLRKFLNSAWVRRWHDVEVKGEFLIPVMVSNAQTFEGSVFGSLGRKAFQDLSLEGREIVRDYENALNSPFEEYRENQRHWADTDAVRDLEDEGDRTIEKMIMRKAEETSTLARASKITLGQGGALWKEVAMTLYEPWSVWHQQPSKSAGKTSKWKLSKHTDKMHRRILLEPNPEGIIDYSPYSYQGGIDKDREQREKEREEMVRKAAIAAGGVQGEGDDEGEGEGEDSAAGKGDKLDESAVTEDDEDDNEEEDEEDWNVVNQDDGADEFGWAKQAFVWDKKEKIVMHCEVILVALEKSVRGNLLLTSHCLYFHPEKELGSEKDKVVEKGMSKDMRWRLNCVVAVFGRRYVLRPQALEIFFADTNEAFISFEGGGKTRDKFWSKLRNLKTPMLISYTKSLTPRVVFQKSKVTELWRRRKISNFEYLMTLNIMAGRSFCDITQYPVFPWVLNDYTSDTIDLKDPNVYRDLTKPIGALNETRLKQLQERYRDMEGFDMDGYNFLYGTHYSSPGFVLHYMLRQEPFTTLAIELQGGRFDCPDRLFFDVQQSWRSTTTNSGDFKEAIPELYFCPEILLNSNNLPLGELQDGRGEVGDVILPKWANGSATEFIRIQREALESEYVSNNLNAWIDLIFGCKQRGEEALKANNLFHTLSYEGAVDIDKIEDPIKRKAAEAHIMNFGLTPSQLLTKKDGKHPRRALATECWTFLLSSDERLSELKSYTVSKQYGGLMNGDTASSRGAVVSTCIAGEFCFVVYSDLSVGRYSWSPADKDGFPFTFKGLSVGSLGSRGLQVPDWRNFTFGWSDDATLGTDASAQETTGGSARLFACGFWDREVKVHDFERGSSSKKFNVVESFGGGHRGTITSLSVCGSYLVTGGADGTARVYVHGDGPLADALEDGYVKSSAAASLNNQNVEASVRQIHVLWGTTGQVTCVDACSATDIILTGGDGGTVAVHSLRRGRFVRLVDVGGKPVSVKADKDGTFAVLRDDGVLQSWTINGRRQATTQAGGDANVLEVSPGGKYALVGSSDGHLKFYSLHDLSVVLELDLGDGGGITSLAFSPFDNSVDQYLIVGRESGLVTIVTDPKHRLVCLDTALNQLPWFE